ncbi:MAG TPA: lysophospholipid acyltransferase family protein [Thermodesulfobacteriota bacterium]|nr:lysophospholipid acyltransferase family protein [Thermodesulfobacteriota bacterium]
MAQIIFSFRFRVKVEGLHHLPAEGTALLIPKHQQWWDVPLLGTFIPRSLHFLAKKELFDHPLSRFYMRRMGGIAIDRGNPLKSLPTFRSLFPLLEKQAFLVLFPEGTYFPGTLGPGKWRLIQMILRLQEKRGLTPIPFIPVGIRYGSHPSGRSKTVEIIIGPGLSEANSQRAEDFTNELLTRVGVLSGL